MCRCSDICRLDVETRLRRSSAVSLPVCQPLRCPANGLSLCRLPSVIWLSRQHKHANNIYCAHTTRTTNGCLSVCEFVCVILKQSSRVVVHLFRLNCVHDTVKCVCSNVLTQSGFRVIGGFEYHNVRNTFRRLVFDNDTISCLCVVGMWLTRSFHLFCVVGGLCVAQISPTDTVTCFTWHSVFEWHISAYNFGPKLIFVVARVTFDDVVAAVDDRTETFRHSDPTQHTTRHTHIWTNDDE